MGLSGDNHRQHVQDRHYKNHLRNTRFTRAPNRPLHEENTNLPK